MYNGYGGRQEYFEAALSNFVFDVASGGSIRHLVDRGYSVDQIIKELAFPTPRERVEKTVFQYMVETGILQFDCNKEGMQRQPVGTKNRYQWNSSLVENIVRNGEENSYMQCPFGIWIKKDKNKLQQVISCLTAREQEYILGIQWEEKIMYHRLNSRMLEIGVQLAVKEGFQAEFYFLKENRILCNEK